MRGRLGVVSALILLAAQAAIAQPKFRIDEYMSEQVKRSTGLYKLTPEDLYQLNLYFSYQIELALASGRESAIVRSRRSPFSVARHKRDN